MPKKLFWRIVAAFWISMALSVVAISIFLKNPSDTNSDFVWALTGRLLVFFVISAVVMLFATRSVTRPMSWLRSAAKSLAAGELTTRVVPDHSQKTVGEMDTLIQEFNEMAQRVEDLIRSQRQLIAHVSHELRSPLARMSLALDMLRQFPEDKDEHLARCENELGKLNDLIESLLTLSRLESATLVVKEDPIDLKDLALDVVADLEFEAPERECTVSSLIAGPCLVKGDRVLLRSAVENIVRNAIQYGEQNTVILVEVAPATSHVQLTVTNIGPSVPDEESSACSSHSFEVPQRWPGAPMDTGSAWPSPLERSRCTMVQSGRKIRSLGSQ
jgi:two-component system sensor histidine kinase CpxA